MVRRLLRWALVGLVILLVAVQVVPYGRNHTNPPVRSEPAWDSPTTRDLAARACHDCHSNETVWPWYSTIAPISWLIQRDVDQGRRELNFSEWDRRQREARESAKAVRKGEMPPWYYTVAQPRARLSAPEVQALVRGLDATFGQDRGQGRGKGERREKGDEREKGKRRKKGEAREMPELRVQRRGQG